MKNQFTSQRTTSVKILPTLQALSKDSMCSDGYHGKGWKTRYTATTLIIKALIRYNPSLSPATHPLHHAFSDNPELLELPRTIPNPRELVRPARPFPRSKLNKAE
jgi:hypothetical protein